MQFKCKKSIKKWEKTFIFVYIEEIRKCYQN